MGNNMQDAIFNELFQKIKGKIRKWITPKKVRVKIANGKEFFLYNPSFFLETEIYWQGFDNFDWEINTRKIWSILCTKSCFIFDVGSNTGIFSMLAKAQNPNASVHAFEPQPNIYEVLKKNNKINDFDISCENLAVSNIIGNLPFYNYGQDSFSKRNTTAGSLNKKWRPNNQSSIEVDVIPLDSYIKNNGIKNVDLLKIDVETLEVEVLEGFKNHLYIFKPIIIIEIQNTKIGNKLRTFFSDENYSFFNIDESKGLIPVNTLGENKGLNYLICPNEKLELVENIGDNL